MEPTQNEHQAEMAELRAEEDMHAEHNEGKATIMDLMETIEQQAKDLVENATKLREDAFNIFPKF